jgi:hypothetical protein
MYSSSHGEGTTVCVVDTGEKGGRRTVDLIRTEGPEGIARVALYLASNESSPATRSSLDVDGGRGI